MEPRYKRGDTSPAKPGLVFLRYRPEHRDPEYWVTESQFEKEHRRKLACDKWHRSTERYKAKTRTYFKSWYQTPKGKAWGRKNQRRQYYTEQGRVKAVLRSRIGIEFKKAGAKKKASTLLLIGCSIEQFREHLQSQFKEGMAWNNYGKWVIDHIRPCRSFDLLDPKQQRECFHFTNCQPMWASENIRKSDRLDGHLFRARELT